MNRYNFKTIEAVPTYQDFIDATLSKTQRKTPTVIHKTYAIARIRNFYIRKVKFTQQTFHDKLAKIIETFPQIEDVHPFYADLMNVLYDKDHYKIALGRVNHSKSLIDGVAREYCRLLKYGDSLYRCKTLKRIALGRMVTIMKKLSKTLVYLEQVRQHLSRLPSIDPNTRTLILCGFPNVGKSSFMNKVTRAEVEVQPYPFTTKSLYVGQMDYKYLRFQVIDTPGILDHPLEDRNTIEMQAVTALAHIRAAIIFMVDISELCGHSIEEQLKLFEHLSPLFSSKTVVIGLNKIDVVSQDDLSLHNKGLLSSLEQKGYPLIPISTLCEDNVMELRNYACDLLLAERVDYKCELKKTESIANRLYVAVPKSRDNIKREPYIPPTLVQDISEGVAHKSITQRTLQNMLGDEYTFDEKGQYLVDENEKYDIIPEIIDGKNIADFIDPNIVMNLNRLEKEEIMRDAAGYYDIEKWTPEEINAHLQRKSVHSARKLIMDQHTSNKQSYKTQLPRSVSRRVDEFISRRRSNSRRRTVSNVSAGDMSFDTEPRTRSQSVTSKASFTSQLRGLEGATRHEATLAQSGIIGCMKNKVAAMVRKSSKQSNLLARVGESDRRIYSSMPKHLFSGKRKLGKVQRR